MEEDLTSTDLQTAFEQKAEEIRGWEPSEAPSNDEKLVFT